MTEDDRSIEIVHLFEAPIDTVFEHWSRSELVAGWFAPDGYAVSNADFEARTGARWKVEFRSSQGTVYVEHGEFLEVAAPHRLVFTLTQEDDGRAGPTTTITVSLQARGDRTRMTFRQTGFEDTKRRDGNEQGWHECFGKLVMQVHPLSPAEAEVRALVQAWARAIAREDRPAILAVTPKTC
jgi:uncharacterized protein YndB with AHSA1/START domain